MTDQISAETIGHTLMRPLAIDEACKDKIQALCTRAFEQQLPLEEMKARAERWQNGDTTVEERDPAFTIEIPLGWVVTYTVENHPPGLMRHLVVSVADGKIQANIVGVALLVKAFNFTNPMENCAAYLDENQAIHVIDPFDGDVDTVLRSLGKPQ